VGRVAVACYEETAAAAAAAVEFILVSVIAGVAGHGRWTSPIGLTFADHVQLEDR